MKTLRDPQQLLANGLNEIRAQFNVPEGFSPEQVRAAEQAAARAPSSHADWTDRNFMTLDPAESNDLDQAFAIELAGADILLHYAIADVAWFVDDGDALDAEAWERGTTTYLPDGKASLYPPVLSEKAASLLPDGTRPAIVLSVRVAPDGSVKLDDANRALIRSRAKLAYETVKDADLPEGFVQLAARLAEAEVRRGAARIDPPEQQLERDDDGAYSLSFRPYAPAEQHNASLSLAANIAVADAMLEAGEGLFRVMSLPDEDAIAQLRLTAAALALDWPPEMPLTQFERRLDPTGRRDASFMLAIRRASRGANYRPFEQGKLPWHAAIAAPYAHCTAPLRRLADRYVLHAVLAIVKGQPVPGNVCSAFEKLPKVMARAGSRDSQIDRAVFDLAEVAMLANSEGETFQAVVTDLRKGNARIQLCDLPVVAQTPASNVLPGDTVQVQLVSANPGQRKLEFQHIG